MAYSYQGPVTYSQPGSVGYGPYQVNQYGRKSSALPATLGGLAVGATIGGIVNGRKNPFIGKDGNATDTFARKVLKRTIESSDETAKTIYKQRNLLLKNIDKAKNVEELTSLINANKDAVDDILMKELGKNSDEFLTDVSKSNLGKNKANLKGYIQKAENLRLQDLKNQIESAWDATKKKFEKPARMTDDMFNNIKKSTSGMKAKLVGKGMLIGGAIAAAGGFIIHNILKAKKNSPSTKTVNNK